MHLPLILSDMIKKSLLLLMLIFFTCSLLLAQNTEIKPIKFKKIRKEIKKKKSPYYYPLLFQRYLELDTSLTAEEFKYLYYGFSFQAEYQPYGTPLLRDSLISYLNRKNLIQAEYRIAAKIVGDLLHESPFRLRETFIAAVAWEMAGNEAVSQAYFTFYEKQVDAIMSTGDGLSENTAFVVIYIPDEYEILEVLGFRFNGMQSLLNNKIDMLQISENPYGVTELYFDVSRLLSFEF